MLNLFLCFVAGLWIISFSNVFFSTSVWKHATQSDIYSLRRSYILGFTEIILWKLTFVSLCSSYLFCCSVSVGSLRFQSRTPFLWWLFSWFRKTQLVFATPFNCLSFCHLLMNLGHWFKSSHELSLTYR